MTVESQEPVVVPPEPDPVASVQPAAPAPFGERRRQGRARLWRRAFASVTGVFGLVWVALLVVAAVGAPWLAPHSPYTQDLGNALASVSGSHLMGTDNLGRDVFSRLLYGASVSIWVPATVVGLTLLGAIPLGLVSGYLGGRVDQVLMRIIDSALSFPPIVLALSVVAVLGPGLRNTTIALAIVYMPSMARLIRGQALVVREESFIEASRSLGSRSTWIVVRRVLPNLVSVVIVQATLIMSTTLIAEASLSFLGLGAQPPKASWGNMLQQAYATSLFSQPTSLVWSGAAIALTVLAFNAIGDSLAAATGLDRTAEKARIGRRRRARARRGLTLVDRDEGTLSMTGAPDPDVTLDVRGLSVAVETDHGRMPVVDNIDLTVRAGEVVGLVGESGSGKSVTSMAIMRLSPSPPFVITGGSVVLGGEDLLSLNFKGMRKVRGSEVAMVFQDPMSSLNPAQTVGAQIAETVRLHKGLSKREAWHRAVELLERVGIPDPAKRACSYPHQLSGGMRQRVMIAMALSCEPRLIVADEPTTALDVTIQAQVLQLLRRLAREENVGVIFVTHDLAVVSELCDRVMVMYAGQIVESASTDEIFAAPRHPYTEGLIGASRHAVDGAAPKAIRGQVPRLDEMPHGCRFAPRCPHREEACVEAAPPIVAVVAPVTAGRTQLPLVEADRVPEGNDPDGAIRTSRCRRAGELELRGVR